MLAEFGLTLFSVLTAVNAIRVQVLQSQIEIRGGADLQLKCQYTITTKQRGLNIDWYRKHSGGQRTDVMQYYDGFTPGKLYKGRVNFTGDVEKNDCSIMIKKTHMTDSGSYEVKVKMSFGMEGEQTARIKVTVLVPPSKPVCVIEGKVEIGQTVSLTCHSKEGSPKPTYSWERYNWQKQRRPLPETSVQESGRLTLKNISADTVGYFICKSKNKVNKTSCHKTLSVKHSSKNIGFYGGIIAGAIGVLIILGVIICCCFCCDNGKTTEDYEMEEPRHRREDHYDEVPH